MINTLNIKNFKSIKDLSLDCKRINIFIGAPNVGKSNILEALSLFNIPYGNDENKFKDFIRFNSLRNLFYDNITNKNIEVTTDIASAYLKSENNSKFHLLLAGVAVNEEVDIFNNLKNNFLNHKNNFQSYYQNKLLNKKNTDFDTKNIQLDYNIFNNTGQLYTSSYERRNFYSSIKKYTYKENSEINNYFDKYLLPPFGKNLITIIQQNPEIYSEIGSFFDEYGLELLYDIEKNNFEIQKKVNKIIYKYPFNLIADTLKRIIFYLTVVESNKNSSIILEEPETHSYPPYTQLLAQRIADDMDNQYFITTHSPYLLHNLIENTDFKDLNVSIAYFDDYQTKIKVLTQSDIKTILDDNIEIFYNLDKFITND